MCEIKVISLSIFQSSESVISISTMDASIAKAAPIHYLKVAISPKKKTIFAPIVTKLILVPNAPNVTHLWRVKWSRH